MVGGALLPGGGGAGEDCTCSVKGANDALVFPSLTLMTMSMVVPTLALVGDPVTAPETELKVAQEGRRDI
jgi:hypothetical protein